MRRLILAAALAVSQTAAGETAHEVCAAMSELAETVLDARYSGVRMRDVMSAWEDESFRLMVLAAWSFPDHTSPEAKRMEILRFGDLYYRLCIGG